MPYISRQDARPLATALLGGVEHDPEEVEERERRPLSGVRASD